MAATLKEAVDRLASVCDGAIENDGQGFAGPDTKWGHYFASLDEDQWGEGYRYLVHERLRKYRGQLAGFGIDYDSLPSLTKPAQVPSRLSKWDHIRATQRQEAQNKPRLLSLENNRIKIEFPYSPELVDAVHNCQGDHRFDGTQKCWYAAIAQNNIEGLRALVRDYKFKVTDDAAEALRRAQTATIGTIKYTTKGFAVHMDSVDWGIVHELRSLRSRVGGQYEGSTQTNYIPDAPKSAEPLKTFVDNHKNLLSVEPQVFGRIDKLISQGKRDDKERKVRREAANALEGTYEVPGLKVDLYPFQQAGVHYIVELAHGRSMICDEQGLGKTVQALAAVQRMGAYPVVIVCPSHLKENWANEVINILDVDSLAEHGIQMVNGRKPRKLVEDIIIINYEVLKYHAEEIAEISPKALIVDESQAVKNPEADRTEAVKGIANNLPEDSLILLLSGTPIPNRPIELVSQLEILGKLDDFGGFKGFVTDYVGWEHNGYGYNFDRAIKGNMGRLGEALREVGYIRRPKKEVLSELPEIQRTVVPMEMSKKDRAEYRKAERELRNGPALAEINMLRQATARYKFESVRKWVETFLESGEKLILFAHHREIQDKLRDAFPEAAIVRGKEDMTGAERFAQVQKFQNEDDCKLIICSLEVANTGLTLTAASNVAFIELGWNPSIHDQAEARCYGRINDAHGANAYYLLAKDTLDEQMCKLIEQKREIVEAAMEGEDIDASIEKDLIEWFKDESA
jgi:hypothetical protein